MDTPRWIELGTDTLGHRHKALRVSCDVGPQWIGPFLAKTDWDLGNLESRGPQEASNCNNISVNHLIPC